VKDALGRFQTVLVLGGGSEIAHATLRELRPAKTILAGRAAEHDVRFDALAPETHQEIIGRVFDEHGDIDLVLLAFGVLGRQEEAERDPRAAVEVAATNFVGAVSALTVVFDRMRAQGHGTIVVLSSVAAEVARRSNYVYGASKAGLDAFARGLQLAAAETGVRVLIVRPGFVRTKMTAGLRPAPLSTDAAAVARAIDAGLRRGDELVWVPPALRLAMLVLRLLPRRFLRNL
jgi:decaprenylphospho-beta-D-erythro-pentofuranosid-2-ulose 2-reductase